MQISIATRRGSRRHNCDSAATFTTSAGRTALALVDGTGNNKHIARMAWLCAETAARVGAQRGPLAGILSAGLLVADPAETASGVAVCAVIYPDGPAEVAWVGDCRVYGLEGDTLTQYTTDHTVGEQLRQCGVPVEIAQQHDHRIRTSLKRATVATVYQVQVPGPLLLLTSDGVHDQVDADVLAALVAKHATDSQSLAEALVAAATGNATGYRDDATAMVAMR